MLLVIELTQFKIDMILAKQQGKSTEKIENIIKTLEKEEPLAEKYRDHKILGEWRCCYIELDWLLVYRIEGGVIYLGSAGIDSDYLV